MRLLLDEHLRIAFPRNSMVESWTLFPVAAGAGSRTASELLSAMVETGHSITSSARTDCGTVA